MKRQFVYFDDHYERKAKNILFVDGSCPGAVTNSDIELSHWVPNSTPTQYKSDTSTEICQKFITNNHMDQFGQVSNNHFDTDGLLAAFTLLHPELAKSQRDILEKTSHMGDFGAWQDYEESIFYDSLASYRSQWKIQGYSSSQCFEKGFETVIQMFIDGSNNYISESIHKFETIMKQREFFQNGSIHREQIHSKLTVYSWSLAQAEEYKLSPFYSSGFDCGLCHQDMLPSQVRNFFDRERLCLIAVTSDEGIYFDLLLPEYLWAETQNFWIPNGLINKGQTNLFHWESQSCQLETFNLNALCKILNKLDNQNGKWTVCDSFNAFKTIPGKRFPVFMSYIKDASAVPSSLSIQTLIRYLSQIEF